MFNGPFPVSCLALPPLKFQLYTAWGPLVEVALTTIGANEHAVGDDIVKVALGKALTTIAFLVVFPQPNELVVCNEM